MLFLGVFVVFLPSRIGFWKFSDAKHTVNFKQSNVKSSLLQTLKSQDANIRTAMFHAIGGGIPWLSSYGYPGYVDYEIDNRYLANPAGSKFLSSHKDLLQKNSHLLWKHATSYSYQLYSQVSSLPGSQESMECPNAHFLPLWPWPLTYDLDLRTWPRYLSTWKNASLYVRPFGWDSETDTQTDTHTMSKLLHPSRQRRGV